MQSTELRSSPFILIHSRNFISEHGTEKTVDSNTTEFQDWSVVNVVPSIFHWGEARPKGQRVGSSGGAATPTHQLRGLGSAVSGVRGGAPNIQRFCTIFSTQDDLS